MMWEGDKKYNRKNKNTNQSFTNKNLKIVILLMQRVKDDILYVL